jgi:hypothetical protein
MATALTFVVIVLGLLAHAARVSGVATTDPADSLGELVITLSQTVETIRIYLLAFLIIFVVLGVGFCACYTIDGYKKYKRGNDTVELT